MILRDVFRLSTPCAHFEDVQLVNRKMLESNEEIIMRPLAFRGHTFARFFSNIFNKKVTKEINEN